LNYGEIYGESVFLSQNQLIKNVHARRNE